MTRQKTLAIIGASDGQKALYIKAHEMGLRTIGFACNKGVINADSCDEFYEISVTDTDVIAEICRLRGVDGVVTNASEFLIPYASEIAERLGLICTPADTIRMIQDKKRVRILTEGIDGLAHPIFFIYPNIRFTSFPCVVKPTKGASKKGVSFCKNSSDLSEALKFANNVENEILIEEYIPGKEFSVESLSFRGIHRVIQITDKDNSGPPHFVELGHHQPSMLPERIQERVKECVCKILDKICFENGATHIEMKYDKATDNLYLIEVNCRGGGDHISDTLVGLSTNCDYLKELINISIGCYEPEFYHNTGFSGICYLSRQNKRILRYFLEPCPEWIIYSERINSELTESISNYDRDGFFIYKSSKPLNL